MSEADVIVETVSKYSVAEQETVGENTVAPTDTFRIIKSPFFRHKSRSVEIADTPPPEKPEPVRRPAKVAKQLSLAHHIQSAIDDGVIADMATVACRLELSRARVTQLLDMLTLAPDIQETLLNLSRA